MVSGVSGVAGVGGAFHGVTCMAGVGGVPHVLVCHLDLLRVPVFALFKGIPPWGIPFVRIAGTSPPHPPE
jgi:hypothetical protein